jgi:hypothetical protein
MFSRFEQPNLPTPTISPPWLQQLVEKSNTTATAMRGVRLVLAGANGSFPVLLASTIVPSSDMIVVPGLASRRPLSLLMWAMMPT